MAITSLEAFKKYQLKLNKLDTQDDIDISPGEFVIIYNEVQNIWFKDQYVNTSTRFINDIQSLVVSDQQLKKYRDMKEYSEFFLPDNYFDYIRSYSTASKNNCKNRIIYNNEVKLTDLSSYLKDSNMNPSFEYEETVITFSEDKVRVYKTDFNVDSILFTFYRYPKQIDIEGYIKIDGSNSETINPELSDIDVDEIIDRCVMETQRRYSDVEGLQLSNTRQQNLKQ